MLKGIALLFKRLHLCWGKANEYTIGMEYTSVESLIPLKGENNLASRDVKSELEKKRGNVIVKELQITVLNVFLSFSCF